MAQILGVKVQSGLSKAGKDYNIVTATYVEPFQNIDKENLRINNYGLNVVVRQFGYLEQADVNELRSRVSAQKFPCEGKLITEERQNFGKYESALVNIVFDKE